MPECPDCGAEMELVDPETTPGGSVYECPDCRFSSGRSGIESGYNL